MARRQAACLCNHGERDGAGQISDQHLLGPPFLPGREAASDKVRCGLHAAKGMPYARSTINDRVQSVCRFYGWMHRHGWIAELPFQANDVRIFSGASSPS
jgi:hypothetical protein